MRKKIKWISTTTSLIAALASIGGYKLSGKLMYIQQKDPNFIKELSKKQDRKTYDSFDEMMVAINKDEV